MSGENVELHRRATVTPVFPWQGEKNVYCGVVLAPANRSTPPFLNGEHSACGPSGLIGRPRHDRRRPEVRDGDVSMFIMPAPVC